MGNIAAAENVLAMPKVLAPGFEIPDFKSVLIGELAQSGAWVVADVITNSSWPINSQKVRWAGADVWIIPITKDHFPAVAMMVPRDKSRAECEELLMRFLSTLSWVEEAGYLVEGGLRGGNLPRPMGRTQQRGFSICQEFDLSYFPEVSDKKPMLALALMREGRGLNHAGYAFLSFFKVLETAFPDGKKRGEWITSTLPGLSGFRIQEAFEAIRKQGPTTPEQISRHLFESSRCAMAHGAHDPIVDPDRPGDQRRLSSELPIIRALAVKAVEDVWGVETRGTNFRKHLYELSGFKKILGADIIGYMLDGSEPTEQKMVEVPEISVRIRRKASYPPLESLRCKDLRRQGKLLRMHFESELGDVLFRIALDFAAERINFDLFTDVGVHDLGSAQSADRIHEVKRFWQDYFANGQLHIIDTKSGELIGRKDAFIPMNIYFDADGAAEELAYWKREAELRGARERRYAEEIRWAAAGYSVNVVAAQDVEEGATSPAGNHPS